MTHNRGDGRKLLAQRPALLDRDARPRPGGVPKISASPRGNRSGASKPYRFIDEAAETAYGSAVRESAVTAASAILLAKLASTGSLENQRR